MRVARRDRLRRRRWLAAWVGLAAACALTEPPAYEPMAARNQHPVELTVIDPLPRSASAMPPGAVELGLAVDWTSLWLRPGAGADEIRLDGELVRFLPSLRLGLGADLDLEVQLPVVSASGGVLDGFIEAWHDAFQLPQNGRDRYPRDQFDVRARRADLAGNLDVAYELEETDLALGDVPIFLGWFPVRTGGLTAGLRAGVELPAGEEQRGLGNGEVDAYLGAVAGYELGRLALFVWGGHAWAGTPDQARAVGLDYGNRPSAGAAGQVAVADWISGIVQVAWQRSLLRGLDDTHASSDQVLLWLGGRLRLSARADLELGIGEDLMPDVSPDVTFHAGLRWRL